MCLLSACGRAYRQVDEADVRCDDGGGDLAQVLGTLRPHPDELEGDGCKNHAHVAEAGPHRGHPTLHMQRLGSCSTASPSVKKKKKKKEDKKRGGEEVEKERI